MSCHWRYRAKPGIARDQRIFGCRFLAIVSDNTSEIDGCQFLAIVDIIHYQRISGSNVSMGTSYDTVDVLMLAWCSYFIISCCCARVLYMLCWAGKH